MGYCEKDSVVRVDVFKPSGKWYETHAVDMEGVWDEAQLDIALWKAMEQHDIFLEPGWFAICLEPHHRNSHPICIKNP